MNDQIKVRFAVCLALVAGIGLLVGLHAGEKKPDAAKPGTSAAAPVTTAVKAKELSPQVKKGLAYLVSQQNANGGWGQGGGWRIGQGGGARVEGANVQDPPDVASTCIATLALLRAGNTAKEGEYAKNVAKAIDFICASVAKSDKDTIYVTDIKGTQVQSKIGPFVDTFLTSLVLAELKGKMQDDKAEKLLVVSLEKTVRKIEKNQKEDGTFAGNNGWASIFSQALCSKGLNRAAQNGVMLERQTLARAEKSAVANLDLKSGEFKGAAGSSTAPAGTGRAAPPATVAGVPAGERTRVSAPVGAPAPSDAGVPIYNISNQTAQLQESVNTNKEHARKAREVLADKKATKEQRDTAKADLDRFGKVEDAQKVAVTSVVKRLEDKQFLQGFGSNGGEEFLSYLNISETLVVKGGEEWSKWDKSITDNMNRIQNQDGSWSGHHCITGRTFCTSSALLVLMADRSPIPVAAKVQEKK